MEVLPNEAPAKEAKAVTAEDFTQQIMDAFEKAEKMADEYALLMGFDWFTHAKLAAYTKKQMGKINEELSFIGQFFLLENERGIGGVVKLRFVREPERRLQFIEEQKNAMLAQLNNWNLIAQLISEKIK